MAGHSPVPLASMDKLLVVDDDVKDLQLALDIARSVGFRDIEGRTSFDGAMKYLEAALLGECHFPDAVIIDLNLGQDSGYELLRYCYTHARLSSIPVIVWSILGDHQRELCAVFKIRSYVEKWDKEEGLRAALKELREQTGQNLAAS